MPELNDAVIVAATRSPIGRANKGSLVDKRADELMADVLVALMDKVPEVDRSQVQDIICGNVAQTGETGFNIARTAGILAGFPLGCPATRSSGSAPRRCSRSPRPPTRSRSARVTCTSPAGSRSRRARPLPRAEDGKEGGGGRRVAVASAPAGSTPSCSAATAASPSSTSPWA